MTELTFTIPAKDRLAFEAGFHAENAGRWAPFHGYSLIRAAFAIAAALLFFVAIPQPVRAIAVMAGAFFLHWGLQSAMQKLTSVYYLCYFEGLPDVESYRAFLDGEFLYMENRGIREGYPLARAAAPFKDSTYLYVDFPGLARVRIPLSAFPSGDALRDFEEYVCDKMEMPRDAAEALERSLFELQKPEACPQCGEPEMMRIIYGRPTAEGWLRIASGEACHGPDFIRPWLPDWHCTGCGHEWFVASDPGKRQHERLIESVLEKKKRKSA